ncbi:hypothetical protein [Streptomyces sp. NPDC055189]
MAPPTLDVLTAFPAQHETAKFNLRVFELPERPEIMSSLPMSPSAAPGGTA